MNYLTNSEIERRDVLNNDSAVLGIFELVGFVACGLSNYDSGDG